MQFDPIKNTLKAPGSNLLTLKHDELLSDFASTFNLRHHSKGILKNIYTGAPMSRLPDRSLAGP